MKSVGGLIFYLGWVRDDELETFLLWNATSRRFLTVTAPRVHHDYYAVESWTIETAFIIKIHHCLRSIEFGNATKRSYLIDSRSGCRVIQKTIRPRYIQFTPLWAPCVELRELELQSVSGQGALYGFGTWRGQEFVLEVPYDDHTFRMTEWEMRNHRMVEHLDITYKIIAHVFDGPNHVGNLKESVTGSRVAEKRDRSAVYAAIAKLERAFIVHHGLNYPQAITVNAQGKVRLQNLNGFERFPSDDPAAFEQACQRYHWDVIPRTLNELEMTPHMLPAYNDAVAMQWRNNSVWLSEVPSPSRFMFAPEACSPVVKSSPPPLSLMSHAEKSMVPAKRSQRGPLIQGSSERHYDPPPPYTRHAPKPKPRVIVFEDEEPQGREESTASIVEL